MFSWLTSIPIPYPEIVASLIVKTTEKVVDFAIARGLPVPERRHRKQLGTALRKMPFVYKDLELDVVTDFVDVDAYGVDPHTLKPRDRVPGDTRLFFDKIRAHKRIILTGEAGIGKTTLSRFAIQSIFGVTSVRPPTHDGERLLPFYIPLKAVDNSDVRPIYSYLLRNYQYLQGERGVKRLASLARQGRIALFLDGYDEASNLGGNMSLRNELSLLLGDGSVFADLIRSDDQLRNLYADLRICRIWLTSRAEFLRANPIPFAKDAVQLAAFGVHTHRQRLAKHIFAYHKRRKDYRSDGLSAERFIDQLEKAGDEPLRKISDNPLFLTVLCYIYADETRRRKPLGEAPISDPAEDEEELEIRQKNVLRKGIYELISECIALLIIDIDRQKALELPTGDRAGMLDRRASYPDEKLAFLRYLAAQSYLENHSVLEQSWVLRTANQYFSSVSKSPFVKDILRSLGSNNQTTDLVRQLVLSDIFSPLERPGLEVIYDFPHRRFREVLACAYWDSEHGYETICNHLGDVSFSELIPIYIDYSKYGSRIMDRILDRIGTSSRAFALGELLGACTAMSNPVQPAQDEIFSALLHSLAINPDAIVPSALLQYANKTNLSHWEMLRTTFEKAVVERDRRAFALSVPPLQKVFPDQLAELIGKYWSTIREPGDFELDAALHTLLYIPYLLDKTLRSFWPNPSHDDLVSPGFARFLTVTYRQNTYSQARDAVLDAIETRFRSVNPQVRKWASVDPNKQDRFLAADGIDTAPVPSITTQPSSQVWL